MRTTGHRPGRGTLRALSLLAPLLAACASTPPPPPPASPAAAAAAVHYPGTVLTGPLPRAPDLAGPVATVRVAFEALGTMPGDALRPASAVADLIPARGWEHGFLPTGRIAQGVRFASGEEARTAALPERRTTIAALRGVISRGITSRFALVERSGGDAPVGLAVLVSPSGEADGIHLALVLENVPAPARLDPIPAAEGPDGPDAAEAPPPPAPEPDALADEGLLFVLGPDDSRSAVFLVPSPFASGGAAVAVTVEIDESVANPSADPDLAGLVERARTEVARVAEQEAARRKRTPPDEVWPGLGERLLAGGTPPASRSLLAFLARASGASLAEDVALSAPDELVAEVARAALEPIAAAAAWPDREELAWTLEKAAFRSLAAATRTADDAPALVALLVRHAGQVGRYADVAEEVVDAATDLADLRRRVVEENRIFLEDSAPSARLRAHAWLRARGLAPEGYDPLAPREERRAALLRSLEEER